jgi:Glycosyl hydrolase family 65 central catalytic domain
MNVVKPYFPLCLGNGLDSVMVDYSGSMHCDSGHIHLEQHEGAICCWEKLTHRTRERGMIPIAQFPYRITGADGELFEVGTFKQNFNPKTGVLTTDIEACIVKMRIKTFLTDNGLYIEKYKVLWIKEGAEPSLIFFGRIPRIWHLNLEHPAISKIKMSYDYPKTNTAIGKYSFENIEGSICMGVDCPGSAEINDTSKDIATIKVNNLLKGDILTRYISMQDNTHCENYKDAAKQLVIEAMQLGCEKIEKKHLRVWKKYHSATNVKIPDLEMQKIYDTSLWMLRASQNQETGFVTEGLYDGFKRGGYSCFWDMTFMARAWISSNQRETLTKLLDFYQNNLKTAQKYASQLGRKGAYYPWMCNHEGTSTYFEDAGEMPDIQKWNNCCMLLQLFDVYRFWGDKAELKKRLPLIKEILDFLIAEIVIKKDECYFIKHIGGSDENIPRLNDTSHLISLIQGLKGYLEGCCVLSERPEKRYEDILKGLEKSLKGNIRDGLIYPWQNADRIVSTLFTYDLFLQPEGIGKKNIMAAYKASLGEWGLTNPGTFRNLIWPWTEAKAAIAFSTIKPEITYQRLKHVVKFTSTHGIFPEKIRPDGFWILFGYLSAHAGYIYALNTMLAADNGKTLFVVAGVPGSWKNLSFSNIYTASGLGVSLKMKDGKIIYFAIENTRDKARSFIIKLNSAKNKKVKLEPGINILIQEK